MADDRPLLPPPLEGLRSQLHSVRAQAEALMWAAEAALGTLEGLQVRPMAPGARSEASGPAGGDPATAGEAYTAGRPPTAPAVAPRVDGAPAVDPRGPRRFATFDGPVAVPRSPGMPDAPTGRPAPRGEDPPAGSAPDGSGDLAPIPKETDDDGNVSR